MYTNFKRVWEKSGSVREKVYKINIKDLERKTNSSIWNSEKNTQIFTIVLSYVNIHVSFEVLTFWSSFRFYIHNVCSPYTLISLVFDCYLYYCSDLLFSFFIITDLTYTYCIDFTDMCRIGLTVLLRVAMIGMAELQRRHEYIRKPKWYNYNPRKLE